MAFVLRFLRLLSIVVWLGGIVFFAFVVAPVAFQLLPTAHEAGLVVRRSILVLHWIGLVSGVIFLTATALLGRRRAEMGLAAAMLAITMLSQFYVLPAMETDRAGGAIETMAVTDARRVEFERLHVLSERLEGAVLLLGLGVVGLMSTAGST
jgi:hypothetical protein